MARTAHKPARRRAKQARAQQPTAVVFEAAAQVLRREEWLADSRRRSGAYPATRRPLPAWSAGQPEGDIEMSLPVLYVFAISHYCEKARWALDFLGVEYELRHLAPGSHLQLTRQLGATGSSLPLLVSEEGVVQGSGSIIDWAESAVSDPSRRLSPDSERQEECRALEQRLDDVAGVHVRRYYYSEAIVEHPDSVRPIFTRDLAASERQRLDENWGLVRQLMMGAMDLGTEQGQESRRIVEDELDWLDGLLSDGRRFLIGDRFSRADLSAASLLAPLALPKQHPTYGMLEVPPRARADLALWAERPTLAWVREIYREHRQGPLSGNERARHGIRNARGPSS
jgi:glutathione S-transferase